MLPAEKVPAASIPFFPTGENGCEQLPSALVRTSTLFQEVAAPLSFVRAWIVDHSWVGSKPPELRPDAEPLVSEKSEGRVRLAYALKDSSFIGSADCRITSAVGIDSHTHAVQSNELVMCTRTKFYAEERHGEVFLIHEIALRSGQLDFRLTGGTVVKKNERLEKRKLAQTARSIERDYKHASG
jgi:hypothetical protein